VFAGFGFDADHAAGLELGGGWREIAGDDPRRGRDGRGGMEGDAEQQDRGEGAAATAGGRWGGETSWRQLAVTVDSRPDGLL
jgi:hypothetical protein